MASTFAVSRPSEKLGTHSTSVDITDEDSWLSVCVQGGAWMSLFATTSMLGEELSESQTHLYGIHARVRRSQSGIRNMHVAKFDADVVFGPENVHAQCGLVHEIDRIRSRRNVVVRE